MVSLDVIHKKAQRAITEAISPGEDVVLVIPGEAGSALAGTNRRDFLDKQGAVAGSSFGKQLNSWDYVSVSGVEVKRGMTTCAVVRPAPGVLPVTKYGRMDTGPKSVWEAPNALMVPRKDTFDTAVASLRDWIPGTSQGPARRFIG